MSTFLKGGTRKGRVHNVLLGVLLVLSSLGIGYSVDRASAQDSTEISFAFWGDPAEEAAYQRLISEFREVRPDIDVRATYTPSQVDYYTKVATSFAGGDPPDIFLINFRTFGQYAARGALEPVGPYLEASEAIAAEDFYQLPLDAFRYRGGELVCMPQNISSLVVYYNRDMFQDNDVPLPTNDWSWDDFVVAATALTQDVNGDGVTDQYGLVVEPSIIRYASFIWGAGGEIVDDVDNPTTLTLDTPEALKGVNWFISLGATGHAVAPSEAEVLVEDNESRFMNGRAAMLLQSRRVVPTLRQIDGFTWDVAPLPTGNQPATVLHSDAFCMAADSEDKDAAWAFIEFAVGQEGQSILAETGRTVPSMISVAESDIFLKGSAVGGALGVGLPPANSEAAYLDTIPQMRRVPSVSTWPEVEDAFNVAFQRAFYVEIDVEGAIEVATFQSRDAFARAQEEERQRAEEDD
ncbi:MAG: ABC transporter substrate-binding protein [Thermomicrobiales bacterium]